MVKKGIKNLITFDDIFEWKVFSIHKKTLLVRWDLKTKLSLAKELLEMHFNSYSVITDVLLWRKTFYIQLKCFLLVLHVLLFSRRKLSFSLFKVKKNKMNLHSERWQFDSCWCRQISIKSLNFSLMLTFLHTQTYICLTDTHTQTNTSAWA